MFGHAASMDLSTTAVPTKCLAHLSVGYCRAETQMKEA